ncbi:MAG: hypothetical protein KME13_22480 [Myxacorys californica WJT36-NPBG1]|jgi:hypothetical protein|nr:hypothetical protein [Myxacorys californica WJT36-NPBG1]
MVASKERVKVVPITDISNAWGVSEKAVKNWVEFVYQAFDVLLPASGPYPEWGVKLLEITAKHISEKSSFYFAETGETRRLKSAEFIKKIRSMRLQGHFQEFQQFQNSRQTQAEVDEDEAVAGLASITRGIDQEVERAKAKVDQYADQKMDELAEHIERTPFRMMGSLSDRLSQRRSMAAGVNEIIDVTYSRVELPESEVLELPSA